MGASSSRENENRTGHAAKIPLSTINKASKSICKITYKENNKTKIGTGFFMFINNIKYLITNYHNIYANLINKIINIEIYNHKTINIELNNNDRNIKFFEKIDITIIEIKDSDDIIKDIDLLYYDLNYINGYEQYENMDVFILEYPKDEIEVASGKIIEILNDYEFKHNIDTEKGSSGSPIIIPNTLKVIGIHKQGDKRDFKINYASFIGRIFKDNMLNKNVNAKINKSLNLTNNNYIIGEINISKNDIGKNIRIINSYEEYCRNNTWMPNKEEYRNEKEIKECTIEINNVKYSFSYFHNFDNIGKYKIKYTFNSHLIKCSYMFCECFNLIYLNLSNFNTQKVYDMQKMFKNCSSLMNIDLSNFDTRNVTDMSVLFCGCSSLTNLKLSNFNTQNVKNMDGMFYGCSSLKILNLSNFDTKNVINMGAMFASCSCLTNLDLNNFNTENTDFMKIMFSSCTSLTNLNLSNFNTQKVYDMEKMFRDCSSLMSLDLSNFNTQNVINLENMFSNCTKLKSLLTKDSKILEEFNKNL